MGTHLIPLFATALSIGLTYPPIGALADIPTAKRHSFACRHRAINRINLSADRSYRAHNTIRNRATFGQIIRRVGGAERNAPHKSVPSATHASAADDRRYRDFFANRYRAINRINLSANRGHSTPPTQW